MERSHLRMVMMAQAQRYEDHREQRAAVAGRARFVVVRDVAAVLLTTPQLQIYEQRVICRAMTCD